MVTPTNSPASTPDLRIATRESRLALWQAEYVQRLLGQACGLRAELLGMTTRGDQILDRALSQVGGKGLFVKELEVAMAEGRAQLAVHSLKDVPMSLPEGFVLAAIMVREDPRDAWVSPRFERLEALPHGARVGTSSLRRVVQLQALRPDLVIDPVRGNLDTRLRKLDEGHFDALVLAAAGLKRLGLGGRVRSVFEPSQMLPCAGQGALGLEIRADDLGLRERLALLNDGPTWLATHAERAVSRELGGSCSMPLAAHAQWDGDTLRLDALLGVVAVAGQPSLPLLRAASALRLPAEEGLQAATARAEALGVAVAAALRDQGAEAYLARCEGK